MDTEFMDPKALERRDLRQAKSIFRDGATVIVLPKEQEEFVIRHVAKLLAEERERCAQIADTYQHDYVYDHEGSWAIGAEMVAKHIRGQES